MTKTARCVPPFANGLNGSPPIFQFTAKTAKFFGSLAVDLTALNTILIKPYNVQKVDCQAASAWYGSWLPVICQILALFLNSLIASNL